MLGESLSKLFGQGRHFGEVSFAPMIHPMPQLIGPKRFFANGNDLGDQFIPIEAD